MKKFYLICFLWMVSLSLYSQTGYRYKGTFVELKAEGEPVLIESNTSVSNNQQAIVKRSDVKTRPYKSYKYTNDDGGSAYVLSKILVRMIDTTKVDELLNLFNDTLSIAYRDGDRLALNAHVQSSEDVLRLVGRIDNLPYVKWCEPDMISDIKPSNALYPQQYYLKNTNKFEDGSTIDINVEKAWNLTQVDTSLVVAVIDQGVDPTHEDFNSNILPGYTAGYPSHFGEPINENTLNLKVHGEECAGIIAAANNNIGIRGVASDVKILPVNIFSNAANVYNSAGSVSTDDIAQAIRWAYPRADILSCSWGGKVKAEIIEDAINDARAFGRGGKGTVVVFAAGNEHSEINFPANIDGVIAVGAIDRTGNPCSYTNFSESNNLFAFGGNDDIVTIDRMGALGLTPGNYISTFAGTSAACPQVAGIVALMLSANPNLTEEQVRNILHSTARDLKIKTGYVFKKALVDAYAAVDASMNLHIVGPTVSPGTAEYYVQGLKNDMTVKWDIDGTPYCTIKKDYPTPNHITIVKSSGIGYILTLNAEIYRGDVLCKTISKKIYAKDKFHGTYSQESCTCHDVYHPRIEKTEIEPGIAFFVHQGCLAEVTSYDFPGMKITHTGIEPSQWQYDGYANIRFVLPYGSGGVPMHIVGTSDTGAGNFDLLVFSVTGNLNLSNDCMNIKQSGSNIHISMHAGTSTTHALTVRAKNNVMAPLTWKLEVYNVKTGLKVYSRTISGDEYDLDTNGWNPGTYIIRGVIHDDPITQKINIM